MITVLRAAGLEIAIYASDHPPPHVHVHGDGIAKVLLVGASGRPALVYNRGFKNGDMRKALATVDAHRAELLNMWRDIHGGK